MAYAAAIMGGVSALQQGSASEAAGKYNAEMGWQNAQLARQSAKDQAIQQQRENYLRLGDMRANIGASGGTGGSFLDVLGDSAAQGELERQGIIYRGSIKANLLAHGASLSEAEASAAATGGYLRAAGELVRGGYGSVRASGSNTTSYNPSAAYNGGAGMELG
jgi:hypothetical protein